LNLSTLLNAMPAIGAAAANAPEFIKLYHEIVEALAPKDQQVAKAALADLQADNDEGHRRLQEKLDEASRR
jgi:hypothetical protein